MSRPENFSVSRIETFTGIEKAPIHWRFNSVSVDLYHDLKLGLDQLDGETVNLTLQSVLPEGASSQKSFSIKDLMFRNDSSGEVRGIREAVEPPADMVCDEPSEGNTYVGWFGSCTCEFEVWICDAEILYWDAEWGAGGGFRSLSYTSLNNLDIWKGYFMDMNFEGINMIVAE